MAEAAKAVNPVRKTTLPAPLLPGEEKPVVAAASADQPVGGVQQPQTDTVDKRTPLERRRAELIGSNLSDNCVRRAGGMTVLSAPVAGGVTPGGDTTTGGACPVVAPAIEGAVTATDQAGLAPGEAGATAAVDNVRRSTITPEAERMIAQPRSTAAVLPGKYDEAVRVLSETIGASQSEYLRRHPEMAAVFQELFAEMKGRMGNAPVTMDVLRKMANESMARRILEANGITGDVEGQITIGIPSNRKQLAMTTLVVEELANNPSLFPPEVADWLRKTYPDYLKRAKAVRRELAQAAGAIFDLHTTGNMMASGEIASNHKSVPELQRTIARERAAGVEELAALRGFSAAEINRMRLGIARPLQISESKLQRMQAEVIMNTAMGRGDRAVFRDKTGNLSPVTKANYRAALQSFGASESILTTRARGDYAAGSPDAVAFTAQVSQAAAARQRLEATLEAMFGRSVRANLDRLSEQVSYVRRYFKEQQLRANLVTSAFNLGDATAVGGDAALFGRASARYA